MLLLLAAFAVGATLVTDRAVGRANRATTLSAAYEQARYGVGEEESLERKYRLEPGPAIRAGYLEAVGDVLGAMRQVARTGSASDVAIAHTVGAEHRPYLAGIRRMFDAVDRHDTPTALRIDRSEVDPTFGKIEATVQAAATRHRRSSAAALQRSKSLTGQIVWLAPLVFAIGLLLLGLLWKLRRREQHASTAEIAQRNVLLLEQATQLRRTLQERERAESTLAETEERLRSAQRLEAVGQLAGGVAHDFNNLLQVILGYCSLLERSVPEDSLQKVTAIATAAGRGADLTHQLLAFGRRQTLNPAVWEVNAIVASVESMLERVLPSEIDFKALPSEALLRARVDRGQLEQVLVNLVLNARDAMPDGGTLTVFTESFEVEHTIAVEDTELPPGPYIRIVVRDTGVGMSEATAARGFEPFFSTKGPGGGTGLGLATVHGIVRQSGGFISLDSTLGIGTEIAVCLPRTDDPVPAVQGRLQDPTGKTHSAKVLLLVEDEPAVRAVLASFLRAEGYDVLEAVDGLDGLELYRTHRDDIDVVVTDVLMPRLDGWGLVKEIRALTGCTPIVIMSGFAGDTQHQADHRLEQLVKPFAPAEVVRAVARIALVGGLGARAR